MTGSEIMQDIERVLGTLPFLDARSRCSEDYPDSNEPGGCYLSRSDLDVTAQESVEALVKAGYRQRGILRKDFGRWAAILDKGSYAVTVTVDSLRLTDEAERALSLQGFQADLTLSLTDLQK